MAYIYKIENQINHKLYIGKTEHIDPLQRWKEHQSDSKRERCNHRALYRAMNKYGIDNFTFEVIEETDNPEEREIFYISFYDTYHSGYNSTLGGDGKRYLDYDKIVERYLILQNQKKVAEELGIDAGSVRKVLCERNISINKNPTLKKPVKQYSKEGQELLTFSSCTEGARWLIDHQITQAKLGTVVNKITECANHKRKSAYNYLWVFL